MSMSDPIADMLTRVRNAGKARFNSVDVPGSRIKTEIARVLKREGFIRNYKFINDGKQGLLRIYLRYSEDQTHAILGLKRVSKPSRRVYYKQKEIKPVFNGMGIAVLSTSKGILSDKEARKDNVGGEVLCEIW
jgi:small subunit ribosomal protein S8